MYIICMMLSVLVVILLIRIHLMKKSIREISEGFEENIKDDTNIQIRISSGDKSVNKLAVKINHHLTELRRLELKYQDNDTELKEAVANMSHDLRTPLTAICGYLDLLENIELNEDGKRYVKQIRSRSEALKELTEELFRYSVLATMPEVKFDRVNICQVLEESLISFEGALDRAGIIPNVHMPKEALWRIVDKEMLSRIFSNIISNALKYSDGDLSIYIEETGVITFSNTAHKLTATEVGRLFDRFYTVDNARKSTGLGLSIAKLLTERMNGKIYAIFKDDKLSIKVDLK